MSESFERYLASNIKLTIPEIELICSLAISRKINRGQVLLSEGETARHMIFITKGLLRVFRRDDKGREVVLKFSNENRWLSDRESYKYSRPSKVTIEALENSELLLWQKSDFDELMVNIPSFRQMMKDISLKNQLAEQARLYHTMTATAEEKYQLFVQKHAALLNRVPLHMVAAYLGLSRETLSRIRNRAVQKQTEPGIL